MGMATKIVSDPKIMMGKPTIEGTRITVELVLEKLAAGESCDQILHAHPQIPPDSIRVAVIEYAIGMIRNEIIIPVNRRSA